MKAERAWKDSRSFSLASIILGACYNHISSTSSTANLYTRLMANLGMSLIY
jgi:hypothetical protein